MLIECCICCDALTGSHSEDVRATNCGHIFHDRCLKDWLYRSKTCPHCRAALNETDNVRLFLGDSQPNDSKAKECLSEEEAKRLPELKTAIRTAIKSMEKLYNEIDQISSAKTSGKESIKLCGDIRRKLLREHGGANGDSSQVDLKNTEKKISDALAHIAVFEEKMFLTNRSLIDMVKNLNVSSTDDGKNYSSRTPLRPTVRFPAQKVSHRPIF